MEWLGERGAGRGCLGFCREILPVCLMRVLFAQSLCHVQYVRLFVPLQWHNVSSKGRNKKKRKKRNEKNIDMILSSDTSIHSAEQ